MTGNVIRHGGGAPAIGERVFVAGNATLVGDVRLGDRASVWFSAVLRADINRIEIGAGTNVQDGAVIHVDRDLPTRIGEGVTIGHGAIVHAATVGAHCLIGMGAIVLDGAVIGERSLVAAGALVPPGAVIEPGSLVMGSPARAKRKLTEEEMAGIAENGARYEALAAGYLDGGAA